MPAPRHSAFAPPPSVRDRAAAATISILAGSLVTIVPLVADVAFLPPFGFMLLLGWRLRDPELFPSWAPLLLGLFDDLVSGQPLGSAMAIWTVAMIGIDVIDSRLVWRSFRQDWLIATGAIGCWLIAARLMATPLIAHVDSVVLVQIVTSAALYPLVAQVCARIDDRGKRRPQ